MSDYLTRTNGGTSFSGSDVNIYRAAVIASGLRLYAKTGIKPNRAYTPTAMMRAAAEITGRKFLPRAYMAAAGALDTWIAIAKSAPKADAPRADAVQS